MSTKSLPPLLEPYLALPPETSLILLTSTLGYSINWLTARFIAARLSPSLTNKEEENPLKEERSKTAVLLVSWLRDETWWKTEIRRATNLNLTSPTPTFKFLNLLLLPSTTTTTTPPTLSTTLQTLTTEIQTFASSLLSPTHHPQTQQPQKITLILDSPDLLLPLTPLPSDSQSSSSTSTSTSTSTSNPTLTLPTLLLTLRSHPSIHHTILSLSSDQPFLSAGAASQTSLENVAWGDASGGGGGGGGSRNPTAGNSPLEIASAEFLVSQAHAARVVLSVRGLETGAARDVSGVLRVTRGGGFYDEKEEEEDDEDEDGGSGDEEEKEGTGMGVEKEVLYLVQRDGGVKVFGRGEGEG